MNIYFYSIFLLINQIISHKLICFIINHSNEVFLKKQHENVLFLSTVNVGGFN